MQAVLQRAERLAQHAEVGAEVGDGLGLHVQRGLEVAQREAQPVLGALGEGKGLRLGHRLVSLC